MANFDEAFDKFKGIEFSSSLDVLHKNDGENGLTYFGIYQSANPKWSGWKYIKAELLLYGRDIKRVSNILYFDRDLEQRVRDFYYLKYWSDIRLDEVESQKIAEEIFFFYIHIGNSKRAVKYAQAIVGSYPDGVIGKNTIKALNRFDESIFDREYDRKEISYYKRLATMYPKRFGRYIKGWINRATKI